MYKPRIVVKRKQSSTNNNSHVRVEENVAETVLEVTEEKEKVETELEQEMEPTKKETKNKTKKKNKDMVTEGQIATAEVIANDLDNKKVIKKEKGLIERTESSKIILTEDNRQLLND